MKTFSCFSASNVYVQFFFLHLLSLKPQVYIYIYHIDIKSGNKVPDGSFITLLKVIYSTINLFSYPQYNLLKNSCDEFTFY